MKWLSGVAVALLCAGGASPLSAQGGVPVIPARAFAFDTVPARLDSLIARGRRDSVVTLTRNGPQVVIVAGPRRHLADSLPVWCRGGCVWEWDELTPIDTSRTLEGVDAPSSLPWGLEAVGAPAAWAMGARGQGIIVTALDSGIDPTHPGYTVAGGYNAVTRTLTGWADDIGPCNGHGTHTAGTLAGKTTGVAPDATLYGIKVFENLNGQCLSYTSSQIAGLTWAVEQGSRCVNISISGTGSSSLDLAVRRAFASGTLVTRANGNSGVAPANGTPTEIQTASLSTALTRSGFSNYGPTTDLAAPGEGIESTLPGGTYGIKSGTSMAAPHVCGVAALAMSLYPTLPLDSLVLALTAAALPIGSPTPNDYTGYGLVRADRTMAWLQGGVAIAASTTDTIPPSAPLAPVCKPVVAVRPWTASTDVPWLRVTTTADSLCYTIDPALLPTGSGPLVATITTRSTP